MHLVSGTPREQVLESLLILFKAVKHLADVCTVESGCITGSATAPVNFISEAFLLKDGISGLHCIQICVSSACSGFYSGSCGIHTY